MFAFVASEPGWGFTSTGAVAEILRLYLTFVALLPGISGAGNCCPKSSVHM